MKLDRSYTLSEIAELLGSPFKGDANLVITGLNEIHKVEKGDIVFVDHPKYYKKALNSLADVIIIDQETEYPEGKGIIIHPHPFDAFNDLTKRFAPFRSWTNTTGDDFSVGKDTIIHPNVIIGHDVKIGDNCLIHAGVILCDRTIIEDGVEIGPNSVIGHDAFYYKKKKQEYHKMHSCGRTVLKRNVEIGALTTIDKGVSGDTVIGEGTKIDNQVHIGHDTVIGKNCLLAANVGVAGCVIMEDNVTLWGQVGVTSDIVIGENAVVLAQSGISRSLKGNTTYFGSPAAEARTVLKEMAAVRKLPSILENL